MSTYRSVFDLAGESAPAERGQGQDATPSGLSLDKATNATEGDVGISQEDAVLGGVTDETDAEPMSAEEEAAFRTSQHQERLEREAAERAYAAQERLSESVTRFFAWLRRASLVTVAVLALPFVLMLANQSISLFASITKLPAPFWQIGAGSVALLLGLALFAVSRLAIAIYRTKPTPAIRLAQLRRLRGGRDDEELQTSEALLREHLEGWLSSSAVTSTLARLRVPAPEMDQLRASGEQLSRERHGISDDWVTSLNERLFNPLDKIAGNRIAWGAKLTGLATAASPRGVIDVTIVLVQLWTLARDLIQLYGARPSWGDTASLVVKGLLASMLAYGAETAAEAATGDAAAELGEQIGGELSSTLAAGVLRVASPRLAEGTLNGLYVYRVGTRIQKLVRPIVR